MTFRPYLSLTYVGPFFDSFWSRSPALFYGIFLYLGALCAFSWHISIIIPLTVLAIHHAKLQRGRLILATIGMALFWLYASSSVLYPPDWARYSQGMATFEITDITKAMRYGKPYCKMKVSLLSFEPEDASFYAKNIPCWMILSSSRPAADSIYKAKAYLVQQNGTFSLKLAKDTRLTKVKPAYSLVEWRMRAKTYLKCILARFIPPTEARSFLEGVLIGEFHDARLQQALSSFGLQHITVVSGFHFSLIAVILAAFLRVLFPWKWMNIFLLLGVTGYLLFIGPSPSVLRAWIAVSILFLGKLLEKQSNGLNALGLGMIVVLAYDPAYAEHLGFQMSFLATFAILLLYPLVRDKIGSCFPKRRKDEVLKWPFFDQLYFVLLTFFIASFALVISVSIMMLPVSLYAFNKFPLMGIVYNCFFPFFVSIAIFFACCGLLLFWFAPVAQAFFSIASAILDTSLTLIMHAPTFSMLHVSWISTSFLVAYLSVIAYFGIVLHEQKRFMI